MQNPKIFQKISKPKNFEIFENLKFFKKTFKIFKFLKVRVCLNLPNPYMIMIFWGHCRNMGKTPGPQKSFSENIGENFLKMLTA